MCWVKLGLLSDAIVLTIDPIIRRYVRSVVMQTSVARSKRGHNWFYCLWVGSMVLTKIGHLLADVSVLYCPMPMCLLHYKLQGLTSCDGAIFHPPTVGGPM